MRTAAKNHFLIYYKDSGVAQKVLNDILFEVFSFFLLYYPLLSQIKYIYFLFVEKSHWESLCSNYNLGLWELRCEIADYSILGKVNKAMFNRL